MSKEIPVDTALSELKSVGVGALPGERGRLHPAHAEKSAGREVIGVGLRTDSDLKAAEKPFILCSLLDIGQLRLDLRLLRGVEVRLVQRTLQLHRGAGVRA